MPIYFDYGATTPVDVRVAQAMAECLTIDGDFGNAASASHDYGESASRRIEEARAQVASSVGAAVEEVVWTSGATEANNLAIFGVAQYYRDQGRHIITARTEHKAVLDPCRELEKRGWRVTYLAPDRQGIVHPAQVAAVLQPDTVLVSLMHVNNEIGIIQDVAAVGELCRSHGGAKLHVDAAQSVGKCAVDFTAMGIDLMSLSAHKAYGPKGVGALLVAKRGRAARVQLAPLMLGGGQERGLRAGTLATHQVVGMGLAFQIAAQMVSLQAGLAFASTVDPASGADSTVLLTTAQIFASLLFFTSGADRLLVKALADSFLLLPPESFTLNHHWADAIIHFSASIFGTGLRLASPIVVLLLLIDSVLAVLGRVQAQLPLITVAIPVKLAATMLLMALTLGIQPRYFESIFTSALRTLEALFRSGH